MASKIKFRALISYLSFYFLFICFAKAVVTAPNQRPRVTALFIFGDSTVDSGNNNNLVTITKANFPPNGRDFPGRKATGRFSNGRLAIDILSEKLGLPDTVPAFLDPEFQEESLLTGASFASAGSGLYDATAQETNVLTIGQQMGLFKLYKMRLVGMVGIERANQIISGGLFILSAGTVDFTNLYYLDPLLGAQYSITEYQDILLQGLTAFVESVYAQGGRLVFVISLPPFGCLPAQITLHNLIAGKCVENMNAVAASANQRMNTSIEFLQQRLPGLTAKLINVYDILLEMSKKPSKFGFEESRRGCCGSGLIEGSFLCNPATPSCKNASTHVYWDSYHPTTRAYGIMVDKILEQMSL